MTAPTTLPAFDGTPLGVGDRVLPVTWGDGLPLSLTNTVGTVVGVGRSRLRVAFDWDGTRPVPSTYFRLVGQEG